jgi:hypothetical protein
VGGAPVAIWSGVGGTVHAMQQTPVAPPATLEAVLERITYANQETGYTVAQVATDRSSDLLTVGGPLRGAQHGELVAEHQDLQILGGVAAGEQGEQLDGAAEGQVGELRQHAGSLRDGSVGRHPTARCSSELAAQRPRPTLRILRATQAAVDWAYAAGEMSP